MWFMFLIHSEIDHKDWGEYAILYSFEIAYINCIGYFWYTVVTFVYSSGVKGQYPTVLNYFSSPEVHLWGFMYHKQFPS